MALYAKLQKAYKNHRLLSGLKNQLQKHNGPIFLHDTHFSRAIPKNPKLLIYDCVDLPLMHQRTSKARRSRNKYLRAFIDYYSRKAASRADIITVTSPYYKDFLSHWLSKKTSPILLRNFIAKPDQTIVPNKRMAVSLNAYPTAKFWLVVHNRIGEFLDVEGVLKALNALPISWGLCFVGVMDGKNSHAEIQKRSAELCPNHTVLCHDPIYGVEKLAALKCFDLGLVPLKLESQNLKRCIPNRSLEFLGLGIPQLASRTRPLIDLSLKYPDQIFVPDTQEQEHFENALKRVCEKIERKTKNKAMPNSPDWSEEFEPFFSALEKQVSQKGVNQELIILSESNPQKNNRLLNMQTALKKRGYSGVVFEIDLQNHQVIKHR